VALFSQTYRRVRTFYPGFFDALFGIQFGGIVFTGKGGASFRAVDRFIISIQNTFDSVVLTGLTTARSALSVSAAQTQGSKVIASGGGQLTPTIFDDVEVFNIRFPQDGTIANVLSEAISFAGACASKIHAFMIGGASRPDEDVVILKGWHRTDFSTVASWADEGELADSADAISSYNNFTHGFTSCYSDTVADQRQREKKLLANGSNAVLAGLFLVEPERQSFGFMGCNQIDCMIGAGDDNTEGTGVTDTVEIFSNHKDSNAVNYIGVLNTAKRMTGGCADQKCVFVGQGRGVLDAAVATLEVLNFRTGSNAVIHSTVTPATISFYMYGSYGGT